MTKWALLQGFKDSSVNTNQCDTPYNKLKDKNHMLFPIDTEEAFDQIKHPFMTKTLQKVGTEGPHLNRLKVIFDNPPKNNNNNNNNNNNKNTLFSMAKA